ncbi:MAG: CYTH domain-containing protein [Gammaproteobacteria bacterium]|nr:CYTH domain-containing protein [Gammaproteobacteria bacterium]
MIMILEQEIKLQVLAESKLDLRSLTWLCSLAEGDIESQRLISTYYDTPEQSLMTQGLGLRLRNKAGQWLQTVKTSGNAEKGLHQRQEWEHELDNAQFDIEKLKQTPLKTIIENQSLWISIEPLFTTDFLRESIQIALENNTEIEFAYDYGRVTAKQRSVPIHEIEMELKSGSIEQLIQFSNSVARRLELKPSNTNKAQLGYQLIKQALASR